MTTTTPTDPAYADWTTFGPDAKYRLTEDQLTLSLFCGSTLEAGFTGTMADARKLARAMLAGPALLVALTALTRHSEKTNYAFYVENKPSKMREAMTGQRELLQAARAAIAQATA